MQTLSIDIETFSPIDLKTAGVYKYAEDVEIILLAYAFDDQPVKCLDLTRGDIPVDLENALIDPDITKRAFNAAFERACLGAYVGKYLPPEQWQCTMIKSAYLGLPLSLDQVTRVLNVDDKKDAAGKALIRFFCMPCKPTKANDYRVRNLPMHAPDKWYAFKEYCIGDVNAERAVANKLEFYQITPVERKLWCLDQRINERGVKVDLPFARTAIDLDVNFRERLSKEAFELTGISSTNKIAEVKKWLLKETGTEIESLNKKALPEILKNIDSNTAKRVIAIRQELSKTSVKKYTAMINAAGSDERVRGLLQFYGANRTGRWSGRLVQVQNLPRGHFEDIIGPRDLVMQNDAEMLEMCYGAIPDTLSALIRSAFIPEKGKKFFISDFSAIEARVIAWLSGEKWRMEVFATHGKIYEASASQMFKVPLESIGKGSPLRQKGKVAELALGYQGAAGALIQMGALDMGISEDELPEIVQAWRQANPNIVRYWKTVENAAKDAVKSGEKITISNNISFKTHKGFLFLTLPSGRQLSYARPSLMQDKYGDKLIYWGLNQTTKQWSKIDTYGGKLVENIVQAVARDSLAYAMLHVAGAGYDIVMSVHDEIVCENANGSIEEVNACMELLPQWAKGLPLKAEGFESYYYKK